MTASSRNFDPERSEAVLFDLDGVLTENATVHAACWTQTLDAFLQPILSQLQHRDRLQALRGWQATFRWSSPSQLHFS